jgi:hypothetical protein
MVPVIKVQQACNLHFQNHETFWGYQHINADDPASFVFGTVVGFWGLGSIH